MGFLARVKFEGGSFSGNSATGFGSAVSATSIANDDDGVWASYVLAVDVEANDGTWAVAEGSTIDLEGTSEDVIDLVDVRPIVPRTCVDSNDGAVGEDGYDCENYYSEWGLCFGTYDTDDFNADDMCCACGGGNFRYGAASQAGSYSYSYSYSYAGSYSYSYAGSYSYSYPCADDHERRGRVHRRLERLALDRRQAPGVEAEVVRGQEPVVGRAEERRDGRRVLVARVELLVVDLALRAVRRVRPAGDDLAGRHVARAADAAVPERQARVARARRVEEPQERHRVVVRDVPPPVQHPAPVPRDPRAHGRVEGHGGARVAEERRRERAPRLRDVEQPERRRSGRAEGPAAEPRQARVRARREAPEPGAVPELQRGAGGAVRVRRAGQLPGRKVRAGRDVQRGEHGDGADGGRRRAERRERREDAHRCWMGRLVRAASSMRKIVRAAILASASSLTKSPLSRQLASHARLDAHQRKGQRRRALHPMVASDLWRSAFGESIRTWEDLFFTSEGCVYLTVYSIIFLLLYTFFGPAPIDDRQLEFEREWAHHSRRGKHFQQRKAPAEPVAAAKKDA